MAIEFNPNDQNKRNLSAPGAGSLAAISINAESATCIKSTIVRINGANASSYNLVPVYQSENTSPSVTITLQSSTTSAATYKVEFNEPGTVQFVAIDAQYGKPTIQQSTLSSNQYSYSRSIHITSASPSAAGRSQVDSSLSSANSAIESIEALSATSYPPKPSHTNGTRDKQRGVRDYRNDDNIQLHEEQKDIVYKAAGVAILTKDKHLDNDYQAFLSWLKSLPEETKHESTINEVKKYKTQLDFSNSAWGKWQEDRIEPPGSGRHTVQCTLFTNRSFCSHMYAKRDFYVQSPLIFNSCQNFTIQGSTFTAIADLQRSHSFFKWDIAEQLYTLRAGTKIDYCSTALYEYLGKQYTVSTGDIFVSGLNKKEQITGTTELLATTYNTYCSNDYTVRADKIIYLKSKAKLYSLAESDAYYVAEGEQHLSSKGITNIISGGSAYLSSYSDINLNCSGAVNLNGGIVRIAMGGATKPIIDLDTLEYKNVSTAAALGVAPSSSPDNNSGAVSDPNVDPGSVATKPSDTNSDSVRATGVNNEIQNKGNEGEGKNPEKRTIAQEVALDILKNPGKAQEIVEKRLGKWAMEKAENIGKDILDALTKKKTEPSKASNPPTPQPTPPVPPIAQNTDVAEVPSSGRYYG
jgi:hypothetical protein